MMTLLAPYIFIFYYFGIVDAGHALTIGGFIYVLALVASKFKYYTLAKYIFITNLSSYIFYFGAALDHLEGVWAFYALSIGMAYLLANTKWLPIYALLIAVTGFYTSQFQDFIVPFEINDTFELVLQLFLFPSAFVVLYFIIRFFKNQITQNVQELKAKNIELTDSRESLKIQSDKLKEANAQIEEFTYIASHDLKAPLRGINFYSTAIQEDYEGKFPEEAKEMLQGIKKLTVRMDNLVEDVISYSRAQESGLELVTVDLNKILDAVRKEIDEQPQIQIEIRNNQLPNCTVDPRVLKQTFMNLVTNAFKYNESENKCVEFNFNASNGELLVKDNGIGIAEKDHEKVFSFFKRVHAKDKYGGGTGAGLAIAKRLIERLDINLDFESELGKGTTFKLDLSKVLVKE